MASNGLNLQQQRANAEARLKTLVNNDLKEICKAYGYAVSGTKVVLQSRCMNVLNDIVRAGDVAKFEELRYRINNHGQAPPNRPTSSKYTPSGHAYATGYSHSSTSSSSKSNMSTQSRLPPGRNHFKASPFYEVVDTLLPLQDLPEMPQNRHTVKANLTISPDVAQRLRNESNLKIMMYCGMSQSMSPHTYADIAFPSQIEVKINEQDVKSNFKGLKNKPGSTKPADITSFIRKYNAQQNAIQITYALTTKRYAFTVYLVRYVSPTQLTERVRVGKIIPKDRVLEEMKRANADPDIAATSIRMSLKDPVSTMRITLPVRSSICTHNQCFDGAFFMQLQDQAPQWLCPVCNKNVHFDTLCIDKYFEDILNRTPKSIEKVVLEPDGNWTVIKEEETDRSSAPRASYDDDFDQDLVELDTPPRHSKQSNGTNVRLSLLARPSPGGASFASYTPPISSREPSVAQSAASVARRAEKRSAPAIIDLTASDDEEEEEQPARPAKRQNITNPIRLNLTNAYDTPNSMPDRRYSSTSLNYSSNHPQSDPYRPGSMHSTSQHTSAINPQSFHSPSPLHNVQPSFSASPFAQTAWNPPNHNMFQPHSPLNMRPPSQASHHRNDSNASNGTTDPNNNRLSFLSSNPTWNMDFAYPSQSPPG